MNEQYKHKIKTKSTQLKKNWQMSVVSKIIAHDKKFPSQVIYQISTFIFPNPLTFISPIYLQVTKPFFLKNQIYSCFVIATDEHIHLQINNVWEPIFHSLQNKELLSNSTITLLKLFEEHYVNKLEEKFYFQNVRQYDGKQKYSIKTNCDIQNVLIYLKKKIINKSIVQSLYSLIEKKIVFYEINSVKCVQILSKQDNTQSNHTIQNFVETILSQKLRMNCRNNEEQQMKYVNKQQKIKYKLFRKQISIYGRNNNTIIINNAQLTLDDCYIQDS